MSNMDNAQEFRRSELVEWPSGFKDLLYVDVELSDASDVPVASIHHRGDDAVVLYGVEPIDAAIRLLQQAKAFIENGGTK